MGLVEVIVIISLVSFCIILYFIIGSSMCEVFNIVDLIENPLLRLLLITLWPLTAVIGVFIWCGIHVKDYIIEIIEYYRK